MLPKKLREAGWSCLSILESLSEAVPSSYGQHWAVKQHRYCILELLKHLELPIPIGNHWKKEVTVNICLCITSFYFIISFDCLFSSSYISESCTVHVAIRGFLYVYSSINRHASFCSTSVFLHLAVVIHLSASSSEIFLYLLRVSVLPCNHCCEELRCHSLSLLAHLLSSSSFAEKIIALINVLFHRNTFLFSLFLFILMELLVLLGLQRLFHQSYFPS